MTADLDQAIEGYLAGKYMPEPGSLALLAGGLLALIRRRRNR